MGDSDDGAFILLQMLFEPVDGFGVEMVGRLVEEQHVRLLQKQTAERHTTAFTTRKGIYLPVARRAMERIHSAVELRVDVPGISRVDDVLHFALTLEQFVHLVRVLIVFWETEFLVDFIVFVDGVIDVLHTFHHVFFHCLVRIKLRILLQIAYCIARTPYHLALIFFIYAGDNLHES